MGDGGWGRVACRCEGAWWRGGAAPLWGKRAHVMTMNRCTSLEAEGTGRRESARLNLSIPPAVLRSVRSTYCAVLTAQYSTYRRVPYHEHVVNCQGGRGVNGSVHFYSRATIDLDETRNRGRCTVKDQIGIVHPAGGPCWAKRRPCCGPARRIGCGTGSSWHPGEPRSVRSQSVTDAQTYCVYCTVLYIHPEVRFYRPGDKKVAPRCGDVTMEVRHDGTIVDRGRFVGCGTRSAANQHEPSSFPETATSLLLSGCPASSNAALRFPRDA